MLPLRIVLSAWLTPWFARWTVIPFLGLFQRKKVEAIQPEKGSVDVKEGGQDFNRMK